MKAAIRNIVLVSCILMSTSVFCQLRPGPENGRDTTDVKRTVETNSNGVKQKGNGLALLVASASTVIPIYVGIKTNDRGKKARIASASSAAIGLLVGPSAGKFYAEDFGAAIAETAIRTGFFAIGVSIGPFNDLGQVLVIGILGTAVYSIVTTPASVRKFNKRQLSLSLAPTVSKTSFSITGSVSF